MFSLWLNGVHRSLGSVNHPPTRVLPMTLTPIRLSLLGLALGLSSLYPGTSVAQTSPQPVPTDTPEEEIPQPTEESANPTTARFFCQLNNGQHTVMYSPESQPGQVYPWAVPEDLGSAWPAERRCNEISRRLELYRPDGLLELQTALENGHNTVCATTETVTGCRIVFTVPPGQDPLATRNSVFENLTLADSGQTTQGVNTFAEGGTSILGPLSDVLGGQSLPILGNSNSSGINLKPFLDASDGGTGARLTRSAPAGLPLDPNNFR